MALACIAAVSGMVAVSAAPASAVIIVPRNPERGAEPIVAGTKVQVPGGSCTVGAVLSAKHLISRITQYQRASRWIVLAKHCADLHATVQVGSAAVGTVVWRSAASDIEIAFIKPRSNSRALWCAAHGSGAAGFCDPSALSYTPRAYGQVYSRVAGVISRAAVTGSGNPNGQRFCTSGWASGLQCVWNAVSIPPSASLSYQHLAAADADELTNLEPGDSGGPVLSYSNRLLGIISSRFTGTTVMLYTPMSQVLHELSSYQLAPAN